MNYDYAITDPVASLGAELITDLQAGTTGDYLLDGTRIHNSLAPAIRYDTAALQRLQRAVTAAGLAGYDFPNSTMLKSDLNRLRTALWNHLRDFNFYQDGYPDWSRKVSDFVHQAAIQANGFSIFGDGQLGSAIRPFYSDVRFLAPPGWVVSSVLVKSDLLDGFAFTTGAGAAGVNIITFPPANAKMVRFKTPLATGAVRRLASIYDPITNPAPNGIFSPSVKFTFGWEGVSQSDVVIGATMTGRTDLFASVASITTQDLGTTNHGGVTWHGKQSVVIFNLRTDVDLGAIETLDFGIIPQLSSANYGYGGYRRDLNFSVQSKVIAPIPNRFVRVVASSGGDYQEWMPDEITIFEGAREYTSRRYFAFFSTATSFNAIWKHRGIPLAVRPAEVIVNPYERWRATTAGAAANAGGHLVTNAPSIYIRTPHAKGLQDIFPDGPLSDVHHADTRLRQDTNWAEFDEFTITVPAQTGSQNFTPSELRVGVSGIAGATMPCDYWRIPLPGLTQRMQALTTTFNGSQPNLALAKAEATADVPLDVQPGDPPVGYYAAKIGTQAVEYFFNQRLTSADGKTFWYRDTFTIHPDDLEQRFRRWPRWFIAQESGSFYLYLLNPAQLLLVRIDYPNIQVHESRRFYPSGSVSAEEYRAAFKIGFGGLFVGNMPDFQPPYRFFPSQAGQLVIGGSNENAPIAVWTVGKTIGGEFAAGMTLKLHVQRRTSYTPSVDFALKKQTGYDATLDSQTLVWGLENLNRTVHDVTTARVDVKFGQLVFKNKVATISLYPDAANRGRIHDLRLYACNFVQSPGASGSADPYTLEFPANFYFTDSTRGREINPGDYSVEFDGNGTTTITLLRTDGIGDFANDEFQRVRCTFHHFSGALPELEIQYGSLMLGEYPMAFTPKRIITVPSGEKLANPFYANTDAGGNVASIDPKWLRANNWPLTYRRTRRDVAYSWTSAAHTYQPSYFADQPGESSVAGILVSASFHEDCTFRFFGGWRSALHYTYASRKTIGEGGTISGYSLLSGSVVWAGHYEVERKWTLPSGEKLTPSWVDHHLVLTGPSGEPANTATVIETLDQYFLTQQNFFEGTAFVAPVIGADPATRVSRMIAFSPVSCVQNFEVRSSWLETYPASNGGQGIPSTPLIFGVPFAFHLNETVRLIEAWTAAGNPA